MQSLVPPLFTPQHPGTGGRIKVRPDDFEVEEIPSYEPSGQGEHLYLWIEKRGVGSEFFTRNIAQALGIPVGAVGTAGLKDRHAISRQWVSVPQEAEPRLNRLQGEGITVLKVTRHNNKLKPGHLRGNRFGIFIRNADRSRMKDVEATLQIIREQGLPNYYGPQRFGRDGGTAELGLQCLRGQQPKRLRPFLFKFALSAAQSVLFNAVLADRHRDGFLRTVLKGDVLMKWPFGGLFVSEDPATDQPRLESREVVPGLPMFGSRTFASKYIVAEREAAVMARYGFDQATFGRFGKLASGTRRHGIIYLDDLQHEWEAEGLRLKFSLPAGSYATVLLREVMKTDIDEAEEPGDEEDSK